MKSITSSEFYEALSRSNSSLRSSCSLRDCAVILTAEPLVAAAGGALILGENFDHWLAALLILGASAVTFVVGDEKEKES